MSTERKPGSRGVTSPFTRDRAMPGSREAADAGARETSSNKGSTKTVSPKRSFKKKRK